MSEGQDQPTNIIGDYHQTGDNVQGDKNIRLESNAIQIDRGQVGALVNSGKVETQGGAVAGRDLTVYQTIIPKPYDAEYISWKRERENLIATVYQYWIEGYLKQAIHQEIYLFLGMEYKKEAVDRPWHLHLLPKNEPVPPGQTLLQIFEKYGRSLLILGEPGSGKTITLLQLAEQLLSVAQKDETQPVPIVLNLSSWAREREPLINWIVKEVDFQYNMARPVVMEWVEKRRFIFLLDGLDEVLAEHRDSCLRTINEFISDISAEIVVGSRREDYLQLQQKIRLKIAIYIEPLTPSQIDHYLTQFGSQAENIRQMLADDKDLQELAQSPLMLSLLVITYAGNKYGTIPADVSSEEKQKHLFSVYVQRMFEHRPLPDKAHYTQAEAINWLIGIAYGLYASGDSVFYIEKLQPTWLKKPAKAQWLARIIIALLGGGFPFLFYSILVGFSIAIFFGLMATLISLCLCYSYTQQVILHEQIKRGSFSLQNLKETLLQTWNTFSWVGVVVGVVTGLFLGGYNLYLNWGNQWTQSLISQSFTIALALAVLTFYIGGPIWMLSTSFFKTQERKVREKNNQGIQNSVKNSLIIFVPTGVAVALLTGFTFFYSSKPSEIQLGVAVVIGSFLGWLYFVNGFSQFGGASFITHYSIRYLLTQEKQLPHPILDKKLEQYLSYMKDRLFFRQVGGGVVFIHKLLLEYLASKHDEYATNWRTHQNVGERYYRDEKYLDAIKAYYQAMVINDKSSYLFNQLGNAYSEVKRYEEAITAYQQAITLNPQYASAYNNLGVVYSEVKRYEEAITAYQQAIALNPQYANAYYNLGNVYREVKQNKEAITAYQQAIALNPQDASAYNNLGVVYSEVKQNKEAIIAYQQAIAFNLQYTNAYYNLGKVYSEVKRYEEAITAYRQAITLNPQDVSTYYNLGKVYREVKRYEEAIASYQQAISLNPKLVYPHIWTGVLYRRQQNYEVALATYQKLVELFPDNVWGFIGLADIWYWLDEMEKHTQALNQARTAAKDLSLYEQACLEAVARNKEEALRLLALALEEGHDKDWAREDTDFYSLHDDPRFWELVGGKPTE